jgi:hypothetical protein
MKVASNLERCASSAFKHERQPRSLKMYTFKIIQTNRTKILLIYHIQSLLSLSQLLLSQRCEICLVKVITPKRDTVCLKIPKKGPEKAN